MCVYGCVGVCVWVWVWCGIMTPIWRSEHNSGVVSFLSPLYGYQDRTQVTRLAQQLFYPWTHLVRPPHLKFTLV